MKRRFSLMDATSQTLEEGEETPIEESEEEIDEEFFLIDLNEYNNLNTLADLIKLSEFLQGKKTNTREYRKVRDILPELKKLQNMVGLDSLKNQITKQIVFYSQSLYDDEMYPHTVIYGPPGCGKSTVSRILGEIYLKMGFLRNKKFIEAKRSDLIAGYLGQTAIKTQKKIDEASGGVLFIDEAYSLGSKKGSNDSYSKECLDTLNQNLSEKKDFICIIAGYRNELEKTFFSSNAGLYRRFSWAYDLDAYTGTELKEIMIRKINNFNWTLDCKISAEFFDKNKKYFKYFGGSIETYLQKIKIAHSLRVFGLTFSRKRIITQEDLDKGFKLYHEMLDKIDNKEPENKSYQGLYN